MRHGTRQLSGERARHGAWAPATGLILRRHWSAPVWLDLRLFLLTGARRLNLLPPDPDTEARTAQIKSA